MKYSITIDNVTASEWGLTVKQAYFFSWLYSCTLKEKHILIDGEKYYRISKQKVISDIPLLTDKIDTVYRYFKELESMRLIATLKNGKDDYVKLTSKCCAWTIR